MKRLFMVALATLMIAALALPVYAMESEFGGYFRTRAWTAQNFTGEDRTESQDTSAVDARTRLYYTAVFHENLKFVNKFEFDTAWGSDKNKGVGGWGDIGSDGVNIEIKNSYVDFNLNPVNFKVGVQGARLGRGFLFDDDFAGMIVTFKGDNFAVPLIWIKAWEGGKGKTGDTSNNDYDVDYFGVAPSFSIGENLKLNPYFLYAYSQDASGWTQVGALATAEQLNLWYAGLDLDVSFDMGSIWATGIYQGGSVDPQGGGDSTDFKAWLAAVGGSFGMNWGDIHGQFFYATGDDDNDNDWEKFWVPKGQSYYWAEIMGYGMFGDTEIIPANKNWHFDQIGDIMAANFGVTVKPMDKLKISLDGWYAALAEDTQTLSGTDDYLGTEVDLTITYQLVQGLNLDIVGAYLFAGDATTLDDPDDANPYEVGTRLSLSF